MKFNFFKQTPVVEQDPNQVNLIELESLLKDWGAFSTGDASNAADNERRNDLLEKIISKAGSVSEEDLKKAYENSHMDVYETQVLNFEIRKRKNEVKS